MITYTAGGEQARYMNHTVGGVAADAEYLAALAELLDNAPALRESRAGNYLLIRVVTYAQPGTGTQVWALDYRCQGNCQVAEYSTLDDAEDDYEGQVEAAVAHGAPSPYEVTDVPGVALAEDEDD